MPPFVRSRGRHVERGGQGDAVDERVEGETDEHAQAAHLAGGDGRAVAVAVVIVVVVMNAGSFILDAGGVVMMEVEHPQQEEHRGEAGENAEAERLGRSVPSSWTAWGTIWNRETPSIRPPTKLIMSCSRRCVRRTTAGSAPPARDAATISAQKMARTGIIDAIQVQLESPAVSRGILRKNSAQRGWRAESLS